MGWVTQVRTDRVTWRSVTSQSLESTPVRSGLQQYDELRPVARATINVPP